MAFFTSNTSFSKSLSIFLILASAIATCLGSSNQDLLSIHPQECIHQHFSALLRLKSGFRFAYSSSTGTLSSWNPENRDCCAWEGITCDSSTGHVTSLDLSGFYISGQLDFQSLSHLRSLHILKLGDNNFDPSPFPSAIGQLNWLTHLNLSNGYFYGQIPMEMSSLTRLVSLDLSFNGYTRGFDSFVPLKLEKPSIGAFIQNMSSLRELILDRVDMSTGGSEWSQAISSSLPNLRKLSMYRCGLSGPIHPSFFHLPFLSQIDLSFSNLSFAEFDFIGNLSSLTSLSLGGLHGMVSDKIWRLPHLSELGLSSNNFSSVKPHFFGNLSSFKSLTRLTLHNCSMSGPLPTQLGNFTRLELLDLSHNSFSGSIPSSYGNDLLNLKWIYLGSNLLNGTIPSSLLSLPSLLSLILQYNQLGGQLGEFHNASSSPLESIYLRNNKLQGMIPRSIFQLRNLNSIHLDSNNFTDALDIGLFLNLTKLSVLAVSNIDLSVIDIKSNSTSFSFPQLSALYLRSCNIRRFPDFLRNHGKMRILDLSSNKLHGKIPKWIWKVGNGEFCYLNLSHNALQTIEAPIPHLSLTRLDFLDLSSNVLEGSLPIPSSSITFYSASNNRLSEEIPTSICNVTSLRMLDISSNNFVGPVPQCFGELSNFLTVLYLQENAFHGRLLQIFKEDCSLEILDFSDNQLEGQLPISLANCKRLEVLSLKNNQIRDTFPSWIQGLANLRVLILRSNNFYNPIVLSPSTQEFSSMLQIFDISFNSFNGSLPSIMFCGWKVMIGEENSELEYLQWHMRFYLANVGPTSYYDNVIIRSKSLEMHLQKVPTVYTLVDLSYNCFQGQIPELIGILKSLRVLNMSHNGFTGLIPTSLKNLTVLESLDLSQNNISGCIPQEMSGLTFLEVLNLSHNQFMGSIPHTKQFLTFTNKSFQGNPGLCGPPLSKACNIETNGAPSSTFKEPELLLESEYNWKIVAIGFGIGYGVGLGVFCWTLVLWTKGRRAYNKFIHKILLLILPCSFK